VRATKVWLGWNSTSKLIPSRLVGCYYTDRKTSGDIDVRRLKNAVDSEPVAALA
jgi:hypothetical protein